MAKLLAHTHPKKKKNKKTRSPGLGALLDKMEDNDHKLDNTEI